jgi:phosphatidate cytidylyltransferase
MLAKRLIVAIILVPIGIGFIAVGSWPFTLMAMVILGIAGWEYGNIFRKVGFQPATWLLIGGPAALALVRALPDLQDGFAALLSGLVLAAMTHHLLCYEKGRDQAATDFAVTLGGIVYLGVLGSYIAPLRLIPEGKWWTLLVLPPIWLADAGAFFIGSRLGRHPMTARLSPKKTWEGYFGGVLVGVVSSIGLASLWSLMSPALLPWRGAVIGLIIAVVSPLGDLGKSMIKRQAGVKDSSNIIPGHGGVLDRIDTWLWGGVIGYYLIVWFWQG